MKRRRVLLLLALAVLLATLGLVLFRQPSGPKEPVWYDVPISAWITEAQYDPGSERGMLGRKAVLAVGTNALPWYLAQFSQRESRWKARLNRWLSEQDVLRFRFRSEEGKFVSSAQGLCLLGTNAIPALPTLAGYLGDSEVRYYAALAMSGCGETALPYFIKAAASTNMQLAAGGVAGLGNLAKSNEAVVAPLVLQLRHTNNWVQIAAAYSLAGVKSRPDLTVPAWSNVLFHPDPRVRDVAAKSLGELGAASLPVVPDLIRLMGDSNRVIAARASNAVFRIDPTALPARVP